MIAICAKISLTVNSFQEFNVMNSQLNKRGTHIPHHSTHVLHLSTKSEFQRKK